MNQTPKQNEQKINKLLYIVTVTMLLAIAVIIAITTAANKKQDSQLPSRTEKETESILPADTDEPKPSEKNPPETFAAQFTEQMLDTRARYGNMPIIAADFVNEWKSKNIELCDPIVAKIKEALADIGNSGFVETADLPSNNQKVGNGDDIHFCRESQYILGRRYFEEFLKIK